MLRSVPVAVVVGLGLALAACSHAGPGSVPLAPDGLGFYVGTWTCEGAEYDEHGAATTHYHLGVTVARAIDNWLTVAVFDGGKQVTAELKGYEPTSRSYHHLWTGTDGTWGSLTSKGWDGNRLVFDEDHPSPKERTRMTFTKLDDSHYRHRAEVDSGAGYRLTFEKTCRRGG